VETPASASRPGKKANSGGRAVESTGNSRYDCSLGLLTKKFVSLVQQAPGACHSPIPIASSCTPQTRPFHCASSVLQLVWKCMLVSWLRMRAHTPVLSPNVRPVVAGDARYRVNGAQANGGLWAALRPRTLLVLWRLPHVLTDGTASLGRRDPGPQHGGA